MVARGAFLNEQRVEFEILVHLDSIADWQTFMETEAQYYVQPEEALIESIHSLLDGAGGGDNPEGIHGGYTI